MSVVHGDQSSGPRVDVSIQSIERCCDLIQSLRRLARNENYLRALHVTFSEAEQFQPGYSSVLMGYDFHLEGDQPRLIEINNNAAGLWLENHWLEQPEYIHLQSSLEVRIRKMFGSNWVVLAIIDDDIESQFLYSEMKAYQRLLSGHEKQVLLLSPKDVCLGKDGCLYFENLKIDVIYNRHTDFYLESDEMQHIRQAYLGRNVVLTPHPRSYALLGDKRRMVLWWQEDVLEKMAVPVADIEVIRAIVPETHILREDNRDHFWAIRKGWVFKPAARHGGKGVVLGKGVSRKRFDSLPNDETVVQKYIMPSKVQAYGESYKFDMRVYTCGNDMVAVAGRIYQGQVTNFRSAGSGFLPLRLLRKNG